MDVPKAILAFVFNVAMEVPIRVIVGPVIPPDTDKLFATIKFCVLKIPVEPFRNIQDVVPVKLSIK